MAGYPIFSRSGQTHCYFGKMPYTKITGGNSQRCNASLRRETTVRAKMIENSREICYDGVDKRLRNPKRGDSVKNKKLIGKKSVP